MFSTLVLIFSPVNSILRGHPGAEALAVVLLFFIVEENDLIATFPLG